jgi:Flp pilus assembly CpaF family ATPase
LAAAAGAVHPVRAEVVVEVDLTVLPPHRMVELERNVDQFISERVELVEPTVDDLTELVDAELPAGSTSSTTANLSVCMCTVGVSEYCSTASNPLSLFTALPLL